MTNEHDIGKPASRSFGARRRLVVVTVAMAAGLAVVAATAPQVSVHTTLAGAGPGAIGSAPPDFTLPSLSDGSPVTLSALRGGVVVVNFWASWCTTCRDEAATLVEADRVWRQRGVTFLGVDGSDDPTAARTFVSTYGMRYDSVVDADGAVSAQWGVTGYPQTFVIDASGRIAARIVGVVDAATLDAHLKAAVG